MNKFNAKTRTNLTVVAPNNLNEGAFETDSRAALKRQALIIIPLVRVEMSAKRVQLSAIEYAPCAIGIQRIKRSRGMIFRESLENTIRRKSCCGHRYTVAALECSDIGTLYILDVCNSDIPSATVDIHIAAGVCVCLSYRSL